MLYTGKQIVTTIKQHIRKRGGAYPAWVVGVSVNAYKQLFRQHGVLRKQDRWILMHATSASTARQVKAYMIKKLGTLGRTAQVDKEGDFVYAYRKAEHTKP